VPDASNTLLLLFGVLILVLVAVLVVAIVFVVRLIRLSSAVRDPRMPVEGKVAFWVAAIYAVFPVDVLPDPIYLDDVGVLAAAVAFVTNLARRRGILRRDPASGREVTTPEITAGEQLRPPVPAPGDRREPR
jgi:uncharacterized membrane protein YkvA (DUF1232 family)